MWSVEALCDDYVTERWQDQRGYYRSDRTAWERVSCLSQKEARASLRRTDTDFGARVQRSRALAPRMN